MLAQTPRVLYAVFCVGVLGCASGGTVMPTDARVPQRDGAPIFDAITTMPQDMRVQDSSAGDTYLGCPTPCGLAPQCGCGTGQSCSINMGATATECRAVGDRTAKYDCTRSTDCAAGLSCVSGVCVLHCDTHADCAGGRCIGLARSGALRSAGYCSTPCSVGQTYDTGCPGNVAGGTSVVYCFLQPRASSSEPEYTTCRNETASERTGWDGASCSSHIDCHRGHGCYQGTCRSLCVPGSSASQTCATGMCRTSSQFVIEGQTFAFCL